MVADVDGASSKRRSHVLRTGRGARSGECGELGPSAAVDGDDPGASWAAGAVVDITRTLTVTSALSG